MAVKITDQRKVNAVRIISRSDGAIDEANSDWDLYNQDPIKNEGALKFLPKGQPTIFLCNFDISGKESALIKDAMIGGKDDDENTKMSIGKWGYLVTKITLKDIQNPEGEKDVIELKKDSKGYVSDDTMTKLEKIGIVTEILTHWVKLTQTGVKAEAKN